MDNDELLKCIVELVRVDKEWTPTAPNCSLYIRPTMIGTNVCMYVCMYYVCMYVQLCNCVYWVVCIGTCFVCAYAYYVCVCSVYFRTVCVYLCRDDYYKFTEMIRQKPSIAILLLT